MGRREGWGAASFFNPAAHSALKVRETQQALWSVPELADRYIGTHRQPQ